MRIRFAGILLVLVGLAGIAILSFGQGISNGALNLSLVAGKLKCTTATGVDCTPTSSGGIPSGMLVPIASGSCPSGWTEVDSYAGKYLLSTTAAAGDIGTTGGSTSYTPVGSNSAPAFTGTLGTVPAETITWPVGVPAFTGTAQAFTTVGTGSGSNVGAISVPNPYTPAGTNAWPAGVPTNSTASFTPAGSVAAPSFTGTAATIQPPYVKVIVCQSP